ncbi:quinone oxidoreductase family protein [Lentzea xinjiangensis]|uniref:quinone oxidoreductase family protein n=1 Tax=Lentzea xinjiangensis TaxID=402600 RepID=UPI001C42E713|nr:zinc-binding dehydrogenase [Lentzea xinjiangensis]
MVIRRFGGAGVFGVESVPEPAVAAGESLVDVAVAGVNFADLSHRTGVPARPLPAVLGAEIAGVRRSDGRRVAALLREGGGYAEVAAVRDAHAVVIPDGIDDLQAAALLEQGGTAYAALTAAGRIRPGESVVVTAAAGGVGHLAVQVAKALGAGPVVGIASTGPKRAFVASLGADVTFDPASPGLAEEVREATHGGADLVIDTVGGPLMRAALRFLRPFGRVVSVGSRYPGPDQLSIDDDLGVPSVGVFGFWMRHVIEDRALYEKVTGEVFGMALRGEIVAAVDRVVTMHEIGAAHEAMAARETTGKVLVDVRRTWAGQ